MPYKSREKKNEAQRRYRERHPDIVAAERARLEKWKQENSYVPPYTYVRVARYCACGVMIRRKGKDVCLSCEKKAAKEIAIRCQKCGDVFIGDRRSKYCSSCKKHSPSLLEAIRFYLQRRRAKQKGLTANFTQRDWREAKRFFNNRCAYCGREAELHQEHFIPVSKGGGYTKNNIVPACKSCNSRKGNIEPEYFLPVDKYRYIANYLGVL